MNTPSIIAAKKNYFFDTDYTGYTDQASGYASGFDPARRFQLGTSLCELSYDPTRRLDTSIEEHYFDTDFTDLLGLDFFFAWRRMFLFQGF
jgi:hypothetical protein